MVAPLGSRGSDPRLLGLTVGWLLDRTFGERPRASRLARARGLDQTLPTHYTTNSRQRRRRGSAVRYT